MLKRGRFGSVVDAFSGTHTYDDHLRNRGFSPSMWAIGNWQKDTTILRLRHFSNVDSLRISHYLQRLARDTNIVERSIQAELVWTNLTGLNSFDDANVEIGVIFPGITGDTTSLFFPVNNVLSRPKNTNGIISLDIDSYLLYERDSVPATGKIARDSAYITRFNATFTDFVDTIRIDSVYRRINGIWEYQRNDPENNTDTTKRADRDRRIYFTSDTLVGWRHFVPATLFNSVDTSEANVIRLSHGDSLRVIIRRESDTTTEAGAVFNNVRTWAQSGDTLVFQRITDRLIFEWADTVVFRSASGVRPTELTEATMETELIRFTTRFMTAIDNEQPIGNRKPIADTLVQTGKKYIIGVHETRVSRSTDSTNFGGMDLWYMVRNRLLRDTLDMYVRINERSRESVLHISNPFLRVSYITEGARDSARTFVNIPFTEISVIPRSADTLQISTPKRDSIPIISAAMQRFAKIDLDFSKFFDTITDQRFLHIGLADLHLPIDRAGTDFPVQYGDSIPINAIITEEELTPEKIFALSSNDKRLRRVSVGRVHRDSNMLNIPIIETISDFVRYHEIYNKPAPQNAFLYLWLDGHRMGRVLFDKSRPVNFTYILQTRRDGE